jgi:hypothetical protein
MSVSSRSRPARNPRERGAGLRDIRDDAEYCRDCDQILVKIHPELSGNSFYRTTLRSWTPESGFCTVVLTYEAVFQFDVAMGDSEAMQVRSCRQNLAKVMPGIIL